MLLWVDWTVLYVSDKLCGPIIASVEQRIDKIFNTLNRFDEMLE